MTRSPGFQLRKRTASRAAIPCPCAEALAEETSIRAEDQRRARRFRRESFLCTPAAAAPVACCRGSESPQPSGAVRGESARRAGPGPVPVSGRRGRRAQASAVLQWRQSRARRPVARRRSRSSRRCRAGASAASRVTSIESIGPHPRGRPPPRTGRPGIRICGARRVSSAATRPLRRGPARPSGQGARAGADSSPQEAAAARGGCGCA